jgi:hypothetical protein
MDLSVGISRGKSDRGFVEEKPGFGHSDRYDAHVGNTHLGTEGFDGLLDFPPAPIGRVSFGIAMDEQKFSRISFEGKRDFFLKAYWSLTTPSRISVDHIDTDTSAIRSENPLNDDASQRV